MALPSGYTQLQYITDNGSSYIYDSTATGFGGASIRWNATSNWQWNFDIQITSAKNNYILGEDNASISQTELACYVNSSGTAVFGWDDAYMTLANAAPVNKRVTLTIDWNYVQCSTSGSAGNTAYRFMSTNTSSTSMSNDSSEGGGGGVLFAQQQRSFSTSVGFTGIIYGVTQYIDKVLKTNLVPAKRDSDGAVGLYDTLKNNFFASSGAAFTAGPPVSYVITVTASPTQGGTVTGGGTLSANSTTTLNATPNAGYKFVGWTLNGTQVSSSTSYTVSVDSNKTYLGVFELIPKSTISATIVPTNAGTVSGLGTYTTGTVVSLSATPITGYSFEKFTINGTNYTTNPTQVTVSSNMTVTATFKLSTPSGSIDILKSVDMTALKQRLNIEMNRRNGYGSLSGWNKSFTTAPNVGTTVIVKQLDETKGLATGSSDSKYAAGGTVIYNDINNPITKLEGGTSASTSCSGLCTGFCTSTCSGAAKGISCTDCTSTCTADCTSSCTTGCSDGCTKTCGSACINTCTGTCANSATGH